MKPLYLDTGLVLKLLVAEPLSPAVHTFIAARGAPIWYSRIIVLEVENTLQAMRSRRQLSPAELASVRSLVEQLILEQKFLSPSLTLDAVADELLRLAPTITARTGCRTLDLLHIATARLLDAPEFISTDRRQLAAAKLAGLRTRNLAA